MRAPRFTLAFLSLMVGAPALGLPAASPAGWEEAVLLADAGTESRSPDAEGNRRKKKKGGEEDEEDFVPSAPETTPT